MLLCCQVSIRAITGPAAGFDEGRPGGSRSHSTKFFYFLGDFSLETRPCCRLCFLCFYYFCDSKSIIEISRFQLFFSEIFVILKNSDILFGSEYKREI